MKVNLNDTPKSLNQLRRFLNSIYPELTIYRHRGVASYYWSSASDKDVKEDHLGVGLATCFTTSIYIYHWSQLSFASWKEAAEQIINEAKPHIERHRRENEPKKVGRPRKGKESTAPVTVRLEPEAKAAIKEVFGSVQGLIDYVTLGRGKKKEVDELWSIAEWRSLDNKGGMK